MQVDSTLWREWVALFEENLPVGPHRQGIEPIKSKGVSQQKSQIRQEIWCILDLMGNQCGLSEQVTCLNRLLDTAFECHPGFPNDLGKVPSSPRGFRFVVVHALVQLGRGFYVSIL